jgi:hypothetical protein
MNLLSHSMTLMLTLCWYFRWLIRYMSASIIIEANPSFRYRLKEYPNYLLVTRSSNLNPLLSSLKSCLLIARHLPIPSENSLGY